MFNFRLTSKSRRECCPSQHWELSEAEQWCEYGFQEQLQVAVLQQAVENGSFNNHLPIDLSKKKSPVPQRLQKPVCLAKRVAPVLSLKLERAEENFILFFNHSHEWSLDMNDIELDKENKHLA